MTNSNKNIKMDLKLSPTIISLIIFLVLWCIIGVIAFITSIICFFRTGTTIEKILGFALALFFGPFYFIFYALSDNYCK